MPRNFTTIFFLSLIVVWAADQGREHKFQQAVDLMETKGDLPAAIKLFNEAAKSSDRSLVARSLLYLGQCREKLGQDGARKDYDRIVRDFADQREVASEARARLASLTRGAVNARGVSVRQVWAGPDVATEGTVSPDGRYMPFADWGNGDLALRDLVTGEKRLLTHNPQGSDDGAEGAAWSPDGKRIAFAFETKDSYAVRIVGTDGSGLRQIYRDEKASLEPTGWSADGKSIVVAIHMRDKPTQFAWITVSDGSVKIVKTLQQRGVRPYLSPDARYIAYAVGRKIFLIASDGSGETPLIDEPADSYILGWLPDGKRVLFGSNRSSTNAAWAIAVADGKPQGSAELIVRDMGAARVWPLGFTRGGAFYYSVPVTTSDIYTAAIDSATGQLSSAKLLPLARKGLNMLPAWSPDGRRLAYYRGPAGNTRPREISVLSPENGTVQTVRPNVDFSGGRLQWSVDGHSLMLFGSSAPESNPSLYNVDTQTGAAVPAGQTISVGSSRPPVFTRSANGRVIAYWLPEQRSLVVQALGEGNEKVLYKGHNSRSVYAPALSPDGQQLAFGHMDRAQKSALMVVSTSGGTPRELLGAELQRSYGIAWSHDGRHILFSKTPDWRIHDYELWRIAADSGEPVNTGLKMTDLRDLTIHPDGRTVAFSAGKLNGKEVWALENFPPVRVSSR